MNKRILFVLHYPPPIHGASVVGKYIKESVVINSSFDCSYINLGTSGNIREIGRTNKNKLIRYLRIILQVRRTLIKFKPDLCYITPTAAGSGFYKDLLIIAIVKLYCRKVIFHFHNKGVKERQDNMPDKLLYRLAFRNTYVILLSPLLFTDIEKFINEEKVFYCPNGIPGPEKESYKNLDRERKQVRELLFLSNLLISKGVLVFLDACAILKRRNIEFHGTVVGEEVDITYSEINDYIKNIGLSSDITLMKGLYGMSKIAKLESADIFVFPTYYPKECLPLAIIEAMQNALPVISTFEGAIPDLVEDGITGFLIPQKDASKLADRIEILIKDHDLCRNMGQEAYKKYKSTYTLKSFENNLNEILKNVCYR